MQKNPNELVNARKEEIIDACAALYENMGFKDITIRDIGKITSFTRTSIYNYFTSKEEIFLALLQREHEAWTKDLKTAYKNNDSMSSENFAHILANTLKKRKCMLKLMSMNLYDMECNSRIENLVAFKKSYAKAIQVITDCLKKYFPHMTNDDINGFIYAFFPFMFGVYPYTSHSNKQKKAMKLAHVEHVEYSIYELTVSFVKRLL